MASANLVILIGNLTRDPDARRTQSGTTIVNLGLAVNRKYKDGQGQTQEDVVFVDLSVWGRTGDFCRDYLKKGAQVYIEGRLKMESWQDRNTGQQRSKITVVADKVQSLSPVQQQNTQQNTQQQTSTPAPPPFPEVQQPPAKPAQSQLPINQPNTQADAFDVSDESIDDIPF